LSAQNGMDLVTVGRVTVLVFESAEQRKSIGELLATTDNELCTRIAVADLGNVPEAEIRAALEEARRRYPLPKGAPIEPHFLGRATA
jgi:hypothetical protein